MVGRDLRARWLHNHIFLFFDLLKTYLSEGESAEAIDLKGKIDAKDFEPEKVEDVEHTVITPDPVINLADEKGAKTEEDLEDRLSKIIADINTRYGLNLPGPQAVKSIGQIRDALLGSKKLERAAKANDFESFKIPLKKVGQEKIVESYEDNQNFFNQLLSNPDIADQVLGAIAKSLYEVLRGKR